MHGPDGTDYENEYVLLEVAEPERIVISHPDPEHSFQLTVVLADESGQTKTHVVHAFPFRRALRRGETVRDQG